MPIVRVRRESIEAKVALLFVGPVAFEAVVLEKSLVCPCEVERGEEGEQDVAERHVTITNE